MGEGANITRDFILGEEIGAGRFGVVRVCTSVTTGDVYAVKSVDMSTITDPIDLECVERETKYTVVASGHPNIIDLHGFYSSSSTLHLVLDLCSGPTLHDRMTQFPSFSEHEALAIFSPLMDAIAHCHGRGVVHRDVKPENVLFDSNGQLRLADFGSAGDGTGKMKDLVGTPHYVAPEMLAGREYGEKVDVWSAGVILYVLLAGVFPFDGENVVEVFENVLRGNLRFPSRAWKDVSAMGKDLVRRMLCRDEGRRLSAKRVLEHPWLVNGRTKNN